jgi:hypothetical protein
VRRDVAVVSKAAHDRLAARLAIPHDLLKRFEGQRSFDQRRRERAADAIRAMAMAAAGVVASITVQNGALDRRLVGHWVDAAPGQVGGRRVLPLHRDNQRQNEPALHELAAREARSRGGTGPTAARRAHTQPPSAM